MLVISLNVFFFKFAYLHIIFYIFRNDNGRKQNENTLFRFYELEQLPFQLRFREQGDIVCLSNIFQRKIIRLMAPWREKKFL